MRLVLCALSIGCASAWWGAFHEVVCGFTLIGSNIDSIYAYVGCYAHSIGCILGALLAPVASSRLADVSRRKRMLVVLGIELALTVLLFVPLCMSSPVIPTVLQVPVNALACIAALWALETLSQFTFKEIGSILVGALCLYALVNYAVFPPLIRLPSGIYVITVIEIALLACSILATERYHRLSNAQNEQAGATVAPAGDDQASANKAFAWQPAFFLAAYGMAFGLMHVESSRLVISFPERSAWLLAGIICATAIVAVFILKLNKHQSVWKYYRSVVFPLIVCAFLMLQEHAVEVSALSVALVYASMAAFFLLSLFACIRISSETGIPLVRIGRTAISICYGFCLVGMTANHCLAHYAGSRVLDSPLATIAVFIMLCAATFWVGDDRNVGKIWGRRIEKDPRYLKDKELEQRIATFAERYALTAKEQTILLLLAQGKRANQISEEQFISVNTVRTHIRNVYNKLDVHSYQDLLNKLDEENDG